MHTDEEQWNKTTEQIIGAAYKVANILGCGFLVKVYENALAHELRKAGFEVRQQEPIPVVYDGVIVGDYYADLIVNDCIIVELKAIRSLDEIHSAQCINYITATKLPICLLLNFGRRVEVKRYRGNREVRE